ncbi:hypothetical protein QJS66_12980 [Kocuria rhizophila]|nr:hypothetical protein QJS66_12980 [Kocuria rhizophila]
MTGAPIFERVAFAGSCRSAHQDSLIERVTSWARDRGDDRLTLTTFADVPGMPPIPASWAFVPCRTMPSSSSPPNSPRSACGFTASDRGRP